MFINTDRVYSKVSKHMTYVYHEHVNKIIGLDSLMSELQPLVVSSFFISKHQTPHVVLYSVKSLSVLLCQSRSRSVGLSPTADL